MKKKLTLVIAVQLIVIVAAGFAFFIFGNKQVEPVEVYVFNKDLKVNSPITVADFTKVTIPKKAVTKNFLLKYEEKENGTFVSRDIKAGDYVYVTDVLGENDVDPFKSMDLSKMRKISMPVNYSTVFGGDVKRGDLVDLVFTGDGSAQVEGVSDSNFQYSRVFMQKVLVYNVTTSEGYPFEPHTDVEFKALTPDQVEGESTPNTQPVAVVTLAVTLDQAEEITARMRAGHVRPIGGLGNEEEYETLGYVIGNYDKIFTGNVNAETGRSAE